MKEEKLDNKERLKKFNKKYKNGQDKCLVF